MQDELYLMLVASLEEIIDDWLDEDLEPVIPLNGPWRYPGACMARPSSRVPPPEAKPIRLTAVKVGG
ncbi:hypothetical protein SCOR_26900 [Sulfidibacter corallicola]|uniref:Uncharacterized protein n=1 Tax=Sulfidibacter corallicola TaxID=2818388 RepID=A0A8A4TLI0_SULCO|nr:hypothetical protein [Sulfidibacter corallicola]QTD50816.1 hypothetical protein J3U87_34970 [Sulfidibacter corallicola]